jgi:molybdopterin-binding protein
VNQQVRFRGPRSVWRRATRRRATPPESSLSRSAGRPIAAGVGTSRHPFNLTGGLGRPITHCGDQEKLTKVSARNQLKGTVAEVQKGQTTAHVRINVGAATLTASITNEAADELKLAKGMTVHAVIKASDVMVGVD